jgi:hypothetical protein
MLVDHKQNATEDATDSLELELADIPRCLQGREEELWQWLESLDANPRPFYEWYRIRAREKNE